LDYYADITKALEQLLLRGQTWSKKVIAKYKADQGYCYIDNDTDELLSFLLIFEKPAERA
jgi:hypothetical protein